MANPEDSKTVFSHRELPPEIESLNELVEGITTDGLGSEKLMEKYSEWAENYDKVLGAISVFTFRRPHSPLKFSRK